MNCELAHERIVAAAYGELPDEQIHELERHLTGCQECARDREELLAMKVLASALPVMEPPANLVARSRMRLEEALDALPPKRWYERLSQRMTNNFASLQAAPVAACLLLVVGAGAGGVGGYEVAQNRAAQAAGSGQVAAAQASAGQVAQPADAEIANISSIVRHPNSQVVEVRYDQVIPQRMEGSLEDPKIRQLLMVVLRYDKNAGVREKAMEGLEPYVGEDVRVRDAVLESLLNDEDPGVRTKAVNILAPVEGDTSVRQVLNSVANSDRSPYIRTVSRQVLDRVPEIQ